MKKLIVNGAEQLYGEVSAGTYDTPGVSHCGIYVGDGRMLHCGDVRPDRAKVEVD